MSSSCPQLCSKNTSRSLTGQLLLALYTGSAPPADRHQPEKLLMPPGTPGAEIRSKNKNLGQELSTAWQRHKHFLSSPAASPFRSFLQRPNSLLAWSRAGGIMTYILCTAGVSCLCNSHPSAEPLIPCPKRTS